MKSLHPTLSGLSAAPSFLGTTAGLGSRPGFTQNPICHIYYLVTTRVALPHHAHWRRRFLSPLSSFSPRSLRVWLHTCMRPQGSAAACQSGDAETLGGSQELEHARLPARRGSTAARNLPLAGGARQTFMHPHTLSHPTNMYSSTVTHLHTQRHVNRHSQYTPEITPNTQTVKVEFSYTLGTHSARH